jgi:hypothetical protein
MKNRKWNIALFAGIFLVLALLMSCKDLFHPYRDHPVHLEAPIETSDTPDTPAREDDSPIPPVNITALALSNSSIRITWNPSGTETSYKVYRAIDNPEYLKLHIYWNH